MILQNPESRFLFGLFAAIAVNVAVVAGCLVGAGVI